MKCTVVIPTYNRHACLKRILSYYHQYGKDLPVLIADSSSEENKKLNRETVSSFNESCFSYTDKYDPNTTPHHKIADALQQVSTKYCVLCADDDFITLNGIKLSVDFLEHNPDFTVAHGRYISFRLEGDGEDKRFCWRNTYLPPVIKPSFKPASTLNHVGMGPSIIFPGALERFHYHMSNYYIPTFYAVHRTDLLKYIWEETLKNTCDYRFGELLPSMLTLIHGKMKCLDVLYGARDASSVRTFHLRPLKDYTAAEYNEEYAKFKACLAMRLSAESGLDKEASVKIIDDAMAAYMKKSYYGRKQALISRIAAVLHHMPHWMYECIRILYRKLFVPGRNSRSSAFMDIPPSSEYCDDFEQIRQIVMIHNCESKLF